MKVKRKLRWVLNIRGFTLVELLVVMAIIAILALIGVPEINRFSADYKVRTCATDVMQNMKLAKAMAIKENREYLVTFDTTPGNQRYMIGFSSNDNDLLDLDADTFGLCKDTDVPPDRLPNGDVPHSAPNADIPDCIKVINLSIQCGSNVIFNTLAPNNPSGGALCANGVGVCFGATAAPIRADFNPDGSVGNLGSVYFQHTERGYGYVAVVSNTAGAMSLWKWNGDIDNASVTTWTELR